VQHRVKQQHTQLMLAHIDETEVQGKNVFMLHLNDNFFSILSISSLKFLLFLLDLDCCWSLVRVLCSLAFLVIEYINFISVHYYYYCYYSTLVSISIGNLLLYIDIYFDRISTSTKWRTGIVNYFISFEESQHVFRWYKVYE